MVDDDIVIINGSHIEINKPCGRIYIMKFNNYKVEETIDKLGKIAKEQNLLKIIGRIPSGSEKTFLNAGFKIEAHIPRFYNNNKDVYFMGKFLAAEREICHDKEIVENVLKVSLEKAKSSQIYNLSEKFYCKKMDESHIGELIELYKNIFETYPAPIFDADYIAKTMHNNDEYVGIWEGKKLVATAEIEKHVKAENAEITAVAILPEYRGNHFTTFMINELETMSKDQNFKTLFGIARATSYGMNIAFAKMQYIYAGTLINNTCISGNLEHMHVWYKHT